MLFFILSLLFCLALLGLVSERVEVAKRLPLWGWVFCISLSLECALLLSAASLFWHIVALVIGMCGTLLVAVPSLFSRWILAPLATRMRENVAAFPISPVSVSWPRRALEGNGDIADVDEPPLRPQERDFLLEDCTSLCELWQQEKGEMSTDLVAFLAARGFNRLELSQEYNGKNMSLHAMTAILTKLACHDPNLMKLVASLNNGLAATVEKHGTSYQSKKYLSALATEESFVYSPDLEKIRAQGGYGIVRQGKYHNRSQLGIELRWRAGYLQVPPYAHLVGFLVPCSDPENLLEEDLPAELCILLPRSFLKKNKQQFFVDDAFVPLSLVLKDATPLAFFRRGSLPGELADGAAYILGLTHRLSAVAAARSLLSRKTTTASLSSLAYELHAALGLKRLSLDFALKGEEGGEEMVPAMIKAAKSRTTLLCIKDIGSFPSMSLQSEGTGDNLWTLPKSLSNHGYWRVVVENLDDEENRDDGIDALLTHGLRSALRTFSLGLSWGWTARNYQTKKERRVAHITAAFAAVMDILLADALLFNRPFPRCDRAWHSFFLLLAVAHTKDPLTDEGWKIALHLCQYELKRILMNRRGHFLSTGILSWFIFPWGRNYVRPPAAEEKISAEKLMIPSRQRQEVFEYADGMGEDFTVAEEIVKLSWFAKDVYEELTEKGLRKPRNLGALDWYKELFAAKKITRQDIRLLNKFYKQGASFLSPEELV